MPVLRKFTDKMPVLLMFEQLLILDQTLFFLINQSLDIEVLNWLLPYWRTKETWIPLYVLIIFFSIYQFKKAGIFLILAALLTIGITDTVSNRVVKKTVQRLRPCNQPELKQRVDLLVHCGSGYSFTSNHAANHFGLAVFLILTLGQIYRRSRGWLWFWATSIAFAQVYVGVHYPLDILGGALIGILTGGVVAKIFHRYVTLSLVK